MRILLSALCLVFVSVSAFGQSDRGSITGTIVDPGGAIVANVPVEARNIATGALYQAATTETGNYTLAQLPAGQYEVSATSPGFKKYTRQGLTVENAQVMRIDIALEVGSASDSVTVTEAAGLLKADTGELSHNITTERLDNLPVLGIGANSASNIGLRNPMAVTTLIPGTYFSSNTNLRVNGSPNNTQAVRLEGQDATTDFMAFSTTLFQPSVDAIQETSILTSNYAPEYGQAGGGIFNYTMKSGTNQFHGTVYDYFVNEALNSATPFTDDGHGNHIRTVQRRNDFGGTVGGPLWIPKVYNGHDRTFFFFNWEEYRETQLINNMPLVVPTLLMRGGDFGQILTGKTLNTDPLGRGILENTIYDPSTGRVGPTGAVVRDPFPLNRIPPGRFDPVALKIQNMIPLPQNSGLINNLIAPWHSPQHTVIPAFKVDQLFGVKSKVAVYWSTMDANSTEPATQLQTVDGIQAIQLNNVNGYTGPDMVSSSRGNFLQSYTTRVNYDYTISPTLLAHVGVGYIKFNLSSDPLNINFDSAKYLGLTGAPAVRQFPQFTGMQTTFGGMKNMGVPAQNYDHVIHPTANASLTWVKGDHTYKFGGELNINGYPSSIFTNIAGTFGIAAGQTGLPSTNGQSLGGGAVGFPYASFLLGSVDALTVQPREDLKLGKHGLSWYAQDSWKITRKFTLDYGIRYDYQSYQKEQYGRMPSFGPSVPNPVAGGLLGSPIWEATCNCAFAKNYPWAYAPRLGAAYQITPKTVLRGGFAIAYASLAANNRATGTQGVESFVLPSGSKGVGEPVMTLANGIQLKPTWPSFDASVFPNLANLNVADPNSGRPARQVQWSFGFQREIKKDLVVDIAYVGNVGVWWPSTTLVNYNAITPDRLKSFGLDATNAADRTLLTSQISSATAAARGFNKLPYPGFPPTQTVAQALRPYPQYGTLAALWAPLGKTWYEAIQAKVTQRFSHGLSFTSTFTFAKALTSGAASNGGTADGPVNDVFNRPLNKYLSSFDQPFASVTAVNYTLPAFKSNSGAMRIASLATRDWTIGAVLQYASGLPIQAPASNNSLASVLFRGTFQNRVPGVPLYTVSDINCHCYDPSATFVLNRAAWTDAPAGTFGTAAAYYDDYRYQRRPSENISLARRFSITERVALNIRVEFTNMFNRTEPLDPVATNPQATQVRSANGNAQAGFGFINTAAQSGVSGTSQARQGTIIARFQF